MKELYIIWETNILSLLMVSEIAREYSSFPSANLSQNFQPGIKMYPIRKHMLFTLTSKFFSIIQY